MIRESIKRAFYDSRKYPSTHDYESVLLSDEGAVSSEYDDCTNENDNYSDQETDNPVKLFFDMNNLVCKACPMEAKRAQIPYSTAKYLFKHYRKEHKNVILVSSSGKIIDKL